MKTQDEEQHVASASQYDFKVLQTGGWGFAKWSGKKFRGEITLMYGSSSYDCIAVIVMDLLN